MTKKCLTNPFIYGQAGSLKQATGALLAWIQRKVADPSNIVLSMGIPRRLSGKGALKASNLAVFKARKKWNVTINGKAGDFWDEEMCCA